MFFFSNFVADKRRKQGVKAIKVSVFKTDFIFEGLNYTFQNQPVEITFMIVCHSPAVDSVVNVNIHTISAAYTG